MKLDSKIMYKAFLDKDSRFEGLFFIGVKTTGIFCRPTCRARTPKFENIEFLQSVKDALQFGYRPCKLCKPIELAGETPVWLDPLMREITGDPNLKITDRDIRNKGIDPYRVRRWFKRQYGITFHAYLRTLKVSGAFGRLKHGDKVIEVAYDSGYESLSGFTEQFKKTTGYSPKNSKDKQIVKITRILTPLGPMLAGAADEGLCLLEFIDRKMLQTQLNRIRKQLNAELMPGTSKHFSETDKQIKEYFEGKRKDFDVPLVISGTSFQKKVWSLLMEVPYGDTRSYKKQAELLGNPNAVRAVGKANGDNKISIFIPCHRVIGENGKLVGYGGGLSRKQYLLDLERSSK
ncbi:bifunctional transcriptional activator/DNA repair enzyme AdaA [candidate division KSB1 bacterium]